MDANGIVYVVDGGISGIVRQLIPVNSTYHSAPVAGVHFQFGDDDGTNTEARFDFPKGMAIDYLGQLYVADSQSATIRKIAPRGTNQPAATNWVVTKLGGSRLSSPISSVTSAIGSCDGTGGKALFFSPGGMAVDPNGTIYVTDESNQTIRRGVPVIMTELSPPVLTNATQVQVPFLLENGLTHSYKLLQTGRLGSPWTTNSAAVLATNRARLTYTFTAPRRASNQFFRVQVP